MQNEFARLFVLTEHFVTLQKGETSGKTVDQKAASEPKLSE